MATAEPAAHYVRRFRNGPVRRRDIRALDIEVGVIGVREAAFGTVAHAHGAVVVFTNISLLMPTACGCSSMVEPQPSKLMVRVRFPSPAPRSRAHPVDRLRMR